MAIQDKLPDRPLKVDGLNELQTSGDFDSVTTNENPPLGEDHLFTRIDDVEHMLHYTEEKGWHKCGCRELE